MTWMKRMAAPGSFPDRNTMSETSLGFDRSAPHPDEVKLIAPAGTVCVFNSHTWHGGTLNRSEDRTRRAIHCYFTTREHQQQTNQQEHIRLETWKRISPAAAMLNVGRRSSHSSGSARSEA